MRKSALGAALVVLIAGCGSSGGNAGSAGGRVVVGDSDNGRTVTLSRGDTLELQLHSTYWRVDRVSAGVLAASRPTVAAGSPSMTRCVPGQGCGTVTVDFRAAHAGRATVRAHRTSCGEARRCTGGAGAFRLTVVVK
jgi:hypothetical protein